MQAARAAVAEPHCDGERWDPRSKALPWRGHGCVTGALGWGRGAGCAGVCRGTAGSAERWQRGRRGAARVPGQHGDHGRAGHQQPGERDGGGGGAPSPWEGGKEATPSN